MLKLAAKMSKLFAACLYRALDFYVNYFNISIKLFPDLKLLEFFNTLTNSFFFCVACINGLLVLMMQ